MKDGTDGGSRVKRQSLDGRTAPRRAPHALRGSLLPASSDAHRTRAGGSPPHSHSGSAFVGSSALGFGARAGRRASASRTHQTLLLGVMNGQDHVLSRAVDGDAGERLAHVLLRAPARVTAALLVVQLPALLGEFVLACCTSAVCSLRQSAPSHGRVGRQRGRGGLRRGPERQAAEGPAEGQVGRAGRDVGRCRRVRRRRRRRGDPRRRELSHGSPRPPDGDARRGSRPGNSCAPRTGTPRSWSAACAATSSGRPIEQPPWAEHAPMFAAAIRREET